MEVTFGKNAVPAADVAAQTQPDANQATPPCCAPRKPSVPAVRGPLLGDFIPEFKDIILPRLNIVQNIGELNKSFPPGALIFNQGIVLFVPPLIDAKTNEVKRQATPPANLVVLGFKPTRYCEKIEGGVKGMIVDTEEAVRDAGGTLDYNEWKLKKAAGMKRFEPMADAMIMIECPSTVDPKNPTFNYEVAGKRYALGMWAMRGTSYTAAAKRVFFTNRALGYLEKGYWSWSFAVTTREETYPGGNRAWVPVCIPKEETSVEIRAFVQKVIGSTQPVTSPQN